VKKPVFHGVGAVFHYSSHGLFLTLLTFSLEFRNRPALDISQEKRNVPYDIYCRRGEMRRMILNLLLRNEGRERERERDAESANDLTMLFAQA